MPNLIDIKQFNQNKLSGFFVNSISSSSGILLGYVNQELNDKVALLTGNQNISGNKNFYLRPTVNGTGVLLSGEAAQVDLSSTVRTTGAQTISGVKTFVNNQTFSGNVNVFGTGIFNALDLNNIDTLSLSGVGVNIVNGTVISNYPIHGSNLVYNTGNQTISGVKNFKDNLIIDKPEGGIIMTEGLSATAMEGRGYISGNMGLSLRAGTNSITLEREDGDYTHIQSEKVHLVSNDIIMTSRPKVNGSGVLLIGEVTQNISPQNISPQNISAQVDLSSTVRTTGAQTISGEKTFLDTITFKKDIILSGATPWPNPNVSLGMEMSNGIYFDNTYQSPYIKYYAGYENTLEIRSPGGSPGALKLLNGNEYIILDGDASEISYRAYAAHNFIGSPIFVDTISLQNIVGQGNGIFAPLNPMAPIKVTGKLKINDGLDISSIEGRSDISGFMSLELKAGVNKILIEKEDGDAIAIQSPDISFSSRPKVNGTGIVYELGDQTISGVKTFRDGIVISGSTSSPREGQLYFDPISKNFSGYNGTSWVRLNN